MKGGLENLPERRSDLSRRERGVFITFVTSHTFLFLNAKPGHKKWAYDMNFLRINAQLSSRFSCQISIDLNSGYWAPAPGPKMGVQHKTAPHQRTVFFMLSLQPSIDMNSGYWALAPGHLGGQRVRHMTCGLRS